MALHSGVERQVALRERRADELKRGLREATDVSLVQKRTTETGVEVLVEVHATPITDDEFVRITQAPHVHLGEISPGGEATRLKVRIE